MGKGAVKNEVSMARRGGRAGGQALCLKFADRGENPRVNLARAAFKRDFLDNHGGRRSIAFKTFFDPRYRPPTPVLVK